MSFFFLEIKTKLFPSILNCLIIPLLPLLSPTRNIFSFILQNPKIFEFNISIILTILYSLIFNIVILFFPPIINKYLFIRLKGSEILVLLILGRVDLIILSFKSKKQIL